MVELTIPLVLDVIRTLGILVGVFYYITTLRNQGKNRMIEMVFQRMQERDLEYYKIRRDIEPLMEGWATNEEYFEKYHYSKTPDLANKFWSLTI